MKLIFIFGLPASGKLTIAKSLASISGYKLFHNHLVVDTLLSVFDFGSPAFIVLREQFWLSVFEEIAKDSSNGGVIFTFCPDNTVTDDFFHKVVTLFSNQSVQEILFVEVACPHEVLLQRMNSESRQEFKKLTDLPLFEHLMSSGALRSPALPPPALTVDSSQLSPLDAARQIARHIGIEC